MQNSLLSFDAFDVEEVRGPDLDLTACDGHPVIDRIGRVFLVLGTHSEQSNDPHGRLGSLRSLQANLRDGSLVELRHGRLTRIRCSDLRRSDSIFKILHAFHVSLPDGGVYREFAVVESESRREHAELTRQLFGLTHNELNWLARIFAQTIKGTRPNSDVPRSTASNRNEHGCDLSGRWIPCRFPYLTFIAGGNYYGSHVSIGGFYDLIAFLCSPTRNNKCIEGLVNAGVDQQTIEWVCDLHSVSSGYEIMS